MADRVYISAPEVVAYLEELARVGVYGSRPGSVATWIVRKEVMRLIEAGVISRLTIVAGTENDDGD